jgi:hypothetical protein
MLGVAGEWLALWTGAVSPSGCVLDLVRQRPPQGDMAEYAHWVVLYAGVHLANEGLLVGVVPITRRQGLVFDLECSDVGGCETKALLAFCSFSN